MNNITCLENMDSQEENQAKKIHISSEALC